LESVTGGSVIVSVSDFLLQLLHFAGKKLHRTAALGADHVVMAAPVVLMLIPGDPIVESDLAGQSTLGKQLQCAVDRGVADARILLLYKAV
jgi:hypothetical protein